MRISLRPSLLVPAILLLCALGFVLWVNASRVRRVDYISGLAGGAQVLPDRASSTGYAGGVRVLIAPERNNDSYQWIVQTQQTLARDEWRLRWADYDNAPIGREVRSPSVYRWWLGLVAWFERSLSIHSPALAVERAARVADPALHVLLLIGTAAFVGWRFGLGAAAAVGTALVAIYPWAGAFLPGQPGDQGLIQAFGLWSILPLLAGLLPRRPEPPMGRSVAPAAPERERRKHRWFAIAGLIGGLGLWVSVAAGLAVLMGIVTGGLAAALLARRSGPAVRSNLPGTAWRFWALGGAIATLLAYLLEYFPAHMGRLQLASVHPLHGIAWLAVGELLVRTEGWIAGVDAPRSRRGLAIVALAALGAAALPVAHVLSGGPGLFAGGLAAQRLSQLPNAPVAANLFDWLGRAGFGAALIATLLPLFIAIAAAGWLLVRRAVEVGVATSLVIALGPVLVVLGFAVFQLRAWGQVDSALIALLVAIVAGTRGGRLPRFVRWTAVGLGAFSLLIGARLLLPARPTPEGYAVLPSEVEALIERDLAHWLAKRAGPNAIVFAPPQVSASLWFHGGLRELGSPYPENEEGFAASVRIASATSIDETLALIQRRGITHIVMPSWDPFLFEYARLGGGSAENSFIGLLQKWMPPRWLRPVAYQVPQIPGFDRPSVALFEVVELQENADALSRLVEYFVETQQNDLALSASYALKEAFADHLGATVARAQAEAVLGETPDFRALVDRIQQQLAAGAGQFLPWDRRVSLAIVLARAKRFELARNEAERCLAEIDEARLRALTTVPLYQFQVLLKAFRLQIADPRLQALARDLLSAEMREAL